MVKPFFCILLLILGTNVVGQSNQEWIVAKYANGIRYSGKKVEEKGSIVSVQLYTSDTIQINRTDVSNYYDSSNALIFRDGKYFETKGWFWNLSFGFNAASVVDSADQRESAHLEFIYARRLNERFNIGAGLGFEFNEARVAGFQFDTQFTSVFAYGRFYLTNSKKRLFLFSRIGMGFPAEENEDEILAEHSSGFNTLNGLGLQWAARGKSRFMLTLGFYTQKTEGTEFFLDNIGNEVETNFDILIKRLIFKFGWEFG
ncbi:MAG: hypothetical protein AAGA77_00330 [Bacteroidota bacterium]